MTSNIIIFWLVVSPLVVRKLLLNNRPTDALDSYDHKRQPQVKP